MEIKEKKYQTIAMRKSLVTNYRGKTLYFTTRIITVSKLAQTRVIVFKQLRVCVDFIFCIQYLAAQGMTTLNI